MRNRPQNKWFAWMLGATLSAAPVLAAGPPAASQAGAAAEPASTDAARMDEILARLASGDFNQRESAQRDLEKIPWQQRAMLAKTAAAQIDAEVKARLAARILQIDEQLAVDPPPIELHVKNATPAQVAVALRDQLGMDVAFSPIGGPAPTPITLDMQGSFWDICGQLAKSNAGRLAITKDNRTLFSIAPIRVFDRHWGFAVLPQSLTYTQTSNPQAAPGADPFQSRLMMQLTIVADPRMKVIGVGMPRITTAVDDLGNSLVKNLMTQPPPMQETGSRAAGWSTSTELQMPANRGKEVALLRGDARFEVQVTETRREVAQIQTHLNEPISLGAQTLTILRYEENQDLINMTLQMQPNDPGVPARAVEMSLVDSNGVTVWTGIVSGQIGTSIGSQRAGPYKLVAVAPDHTRTVTVPFELKHIPLPRN